MEILSAAVSALASSVGAATIIDVGSGQVSPFLSSDFDIFCLSTFYQNLHEECMMLIYKRCQTR